MLLNAGVTAFTVFELLRLNQQVGKTIPPPRLGLSSSHLQSYLVLRLRFVARSRDKLKPLYLLYYSAYNHQTWQDDDLRYLDPLITLSCLVTWQIKNIIYLLLQYLWPPNLVRCWHIIKSSNSWSYLIPQSRGFMRSLDISIARSWLTIWTWQVSTNILTIHITF